MQYLLLNDKNIGSTLQTSTHREAKLKNRLIISSGYKN